MALYNPPTLRLTPPSLHSSKKTMKRFTSLGVTALLASLLLISPATARPVGSDGKVIVAYWADWTGFSAGSIDFTKITHAYYVLTLSVSSSAFSTVGSDLLPSTPSSLSTFVSAVHAGNTQAVLSIGGWGSSGYFSSVVASPSSRQNFANAVQSLINQYNLDGIDIDWEYPGEQGACGNIVSPNDSANYLLLLQLLRQTIGNKFITAATATHPFVGADGNPLSDVSNFAKYFDWINLMIYDLDVWGTTTAPNAPLESGKNGGSPSNVVQAVTDWSKAGIPLNKLVIGTAFYGHTMKSVSSMANNDPSDEFVPVQGGNSGHSCQGGGFSSTIDWNTLRGSFLSGPETAASGWVRNFDPYTQTPWLYNPSTSEYISYDDPQSLQVKVNYAGCMGLKGVMLWEISNDNGELLPILNSISGVQAGSNCLPSTGGSDTSSSLAPATKSTTTTIPSSEPVTTSTTTFSVKTTTSNKTTTPGTPAPSTTSSTPVSTGLPGCTASNSGQSICVSANKPDYNQCINGSWMLRQCGPSTVCLQSDANSIQCGFPQ
ncbi:glycoside hydrolase superfamily [Endogone sp. FLAS-F59071]|nr:glycoside hydrolase superfamily [Endogone sp. FLAS-F59071]|eukprot:RUS20996.1 glycoside hydrolase superfamily [Endogone sp. FLAS-F59071]